jgi:hypothetical protein
MLAHAFLSVTRAGLPERAGTMETAEKGAPAPPRP